MTYEFRLPDIGEGVAEGEVVKWFVGEGQAIVEDAPLVSVLTDKANVEIPSPRSGTVTKIHAAVGEKVKVGGILVTIEDTGGRNAATDAPPGTAPASPPPAPVPPPKEKGREAPRAAEPTPSAGTTVGASAGLATPYVRRLAAERGIDLSTIPGTGPGGRITEADLSGGSRSAPIPPTHPSGAGAPSTVTPVPSPASIGDEIERIPIRGMRRIISEHMAESVHRAAHFTYVEEIEATELMRMRERMAKHSERGGVKLSYLPFIIKAVIAGLRAHPWMNATMDDAKGEIVLHKGYHIGIATAAPEGLIVPVIHRAEQLSINGLARAIQDLSERGREGKLTRPELIGGTFTITSLGALGGVLATPILNYPEVAILGVHKIQRRPAFLADGTIGAGEFMNLSVSIDHRLVDGYTGAQFLAIVKSHLEDPHQLFGELA
ncbi:MAG TPA: dihydrolipoamide acetyltransferase family protein [Thermoplasmata archaeon]|nr:dihydrolipoamide acetyltransferase family protein [Thermoplasmata archaeon]